MFLRPILVPLALVSVTLASVPAGAALVHDYEFARDLSDSVPGGVALSESFRAGTSGAVSAGFYNFQQGAGLNLGSQLPGGTYTIDIGASFDKVNGYNKLVSFDDLASDLGFYVYNGGLNLFNVADGPDNLIAAGTPFDVRLTRDGATGIMNGYLNGVLQFTYTDTTNAFGASSNLWFLRDDTDQNGEDSSGSADYIRIYDTAIAASSAAPEPASWAMMVGGFATIGFALRRRPRAALRTA